MPAARWEIGAALIGDCIHVAGGDSFADPQEHLEYRVPEVFYLHRRD